MRRLSALKQICIILLFIVLSGPELNAQNYEITKINVGTNFDIRKISAQYLGSPDLWMHILRFNGLSSLADLKTGAQLNIPSGLIKAANSGIDKAGIAINDASKIGARILAEKKLNDAIGDYEAALKKFSEYDYNGSLAFSSSAQKNAEAAFRQTKEIREKTIDAIISFKKGDVQKRFTKSLSWQNADLLDNLKENDMARTLALSLANITFHDLSQIKLNENSLAVIQSSRYDALSNKTTSKVRLEKGDAYAMLLNSPKKKFDLDIAGVKTKINSKYFWVEKNTDNTKLANYNGEITLEVKDSAVTVQKNQGSVIPVGGYPGKPTDLLLPPVPSGPADQAELLSDSIIFSWSPADGAANYRLEISSSPDFKKIFKSETGINGTEITVRNFQPGSYYWHVCSVDNMGLPGPYSEYFSFVIARDKTRPFLAIDFPPDNYATKDAAVRIEGKTDSGVKISADASDIDVDDKGNFSVSVRLKNGWNKIEITAVDPGGNYSVLTRDVLFEKDGEIKLTDPVSGNDFSGSIIRTGRRFINLSLLTRPLSTVTVSSPANNYYMTVYADSTGKFHCEVPLKAGKDRLKINVNSPAGYVKDFYAELIRDNEKPEIKFTDDIPALTSANKIIISGTVTGADKLSVNSTDIPVEADGKFTAEINLRPGENNLEFIGSDEAGNIVSERRTVFLDNTPPALADFAMESRGNVHRIIIRASDETQLKKSAAIKLVEGGKTNVEQMKLDPRNGSYSLDINSPAKPSVVSVTLEDYAGNSKEYNLTGR